MSNEHEWQMIQNADPRITKLAAVAGAEVLTGDQDTHYADALYGDMKPYLAVLVGSGRGYRNPVPRNHPPRDYDEKFAAVVAQPYAGTPNDNGWLTDPWLFDVARTKIYDDLCRMYDERWGRV